MTEIKLFNTIQKEKTAFVPMDPQRVTMYVCGPTVYNRAHIGNARPAVVFDTLFRLLKEVYGQKNIVYARNFTDVDDKINKAALENGVDISVITEKYTKIYKSDMALLNVETPTLEPTVTGHMDDIIEFVASLIAQNHAYTSPDGVYFSVESMPNYGKLSGRKIEDMQAGARVEIDENKKHPADFALWKAAKPNEPFWEAPFGKGRPGWHIECSAMIEKNLGATIDIHGGGHDLIFPHHENEIAQSECKHGGTKLANYWLHNGFLNFGEEKMSKSLGNVLNIEEICEKWPREAVRLALLSAHYRAPLDWNDEILSQSVKTLDRIYRAIEAVWNENIAPIIPQSILDALSDDLNTPQALAAIAELVKIANKAESIEDRNNALAALLGAGKLLGILIHTPKEWFAQKTGDNSKSDYINDLINQRLEARANKNWARADEIRDELAALNVEIKDGAGGTSWQFKN